MNKLEISGSDFKVHCCSAEIMICLQDQHSTVHVNGIDDIKDGRIIVYPNMMIYVTVEIFAK